MEENNVFTGKTLDEAINNGLIELRLTRDERSEEHTSELQSPVNI